MKTDLIKEIELADGVTAINENGSLTIKGPKGELSRNFFHPKINLKIEEKKIILEVLKATKREKMVAGSISAHIKNMVNGVIEPFIYKLKICSGHFPMNVSVSGQELIIKNFLGETIPRKVSLPTEVNVKVDSTEILVTSVNKELAGQTAAKIESACRVNNRDIRIFQDGCYIIEKAGKML
jgi:large subunit ribosomal protein L6